MSEPARLFDPDEGRAPPVPVELGSGERLIRVLPDVSGMAKEFDYIAPALLADQVQVGSLVRVDLHGRRVAGWVTAVDLEPSPGMSLRAISKVSSVGPPADVVALGRWAARRWAGRLTPILKTASPPTMVRSFPKERPTRGPARDAAGDAASGSTGGVGDEAAMTSVSEDDLARQAFGVPGTTVVRVGPSDDQIDFVAAAAERGNALVLVPSVGQARWLSGRLKRMGHRVHLQPNGWASGVTGGLVIGSRSAAWAPTAPLDAVLVLDEHDESFQEERVPTWHARDVAIERATRAGVPCVLVSPAPSLAALHRADRTLSVSRSAERQGWPAIEVVDRREEEPGRSGLFSTRVAEVLRDATSGVAILNRKGRAQMLACGSCGELIRTEDGEFLMVEVEGRLVSPRTGETRPLVCAACTATTLKRIRLGVTRAAEELTDLVGRPVSEVSSDAERRAKASRSGGRETEPSLILGTEAALHTGVEADVVVFLDFDQELHAPRYRAAEQAMWLLVRAARLVGGRRPESRVVVQTRSPEHRVLQAAMRADPSRMIDEEQALRETLGFPPHGAIAEISGAVADAYALDLGNAIADSSPGAMVMGPRADGRYLLRADDGEQLAALLESVPRPKGRMRIAVDPPRI